MKLLTQWAAAAGALILVVLAVRHLCRNRLSARLNYALWTVVLVRLLAPLQLPLLPASAQAADLLSNMAGQADRQMVYAIPEQVYPGRPELTQPVIDRTAIGLPDGREYYSGGVVIDRDSTTHYHFMMPAGELAVLLWGVGAVGTALALLVSNLRFAAGLRRSRRRLDVPDCPLPVYAAQGLPSPCLFGLARPAVYLTPEAAALSERQRRHVLAHELTHFAHKDHIWAPLRCLCLALHWYNPLVWLAVLLSKKDGELACDEGTVARLGEGERIPYGRTLVELAARRGRRPGDLFSCSTAMADGKKTMQQRIALLVNKPETKKTALFAAAALVALAAVFVFGGGGRDRAPSYHSFRGAVGSAQAVRYGPPPYSSQFYPDPITDDDLLEQARALLEQGRDLLTSEALERPDVSLSVVSSSLLLSDRPDREDGWTRYLLYVRDGKTYVLSPADVEAEGLGAAAVYDFDLSAGLERLARRQRERGRDAAGGPALEALLPALEAADVLSVSGGPNSAGADVRALVRALRAAGENPVPAPAAPEFTQYSLWESSLALADGGSLDLSAGQAEDVVCIRIDRGEQGGGGTQGYFSAPELYRLIRRYWTTPAGSIVQADLAPVAQAVDRILADELERWNRALAADGQAATYTGAELTQFRLLSVWPDLLKEGGVKLYAFDYGLSIDELEHALWAGGNYADGAGLFHPYGSALHLLTVEREGQAAACAILPWEFLLEEGGQDGLVDQDYLLEAVVNGLRDLLAPVVPDGGFTPRQAAEAYGRALAGYYLSLGPGHPQAVTGARLAGAEVYEQSGDALCAQITLAVDPANPDTVYWQASLESPTEGPWAGHGLDSHQYCLERTKDGWACTDWGTGGVHLPEFRWRAERSFTPDPSAAGDWDTRLTATVGRLKGGQAGMEVEGETGALESLLVCSSCVSLSPYSPGGQGDALPWGETLGGLAAAADMAQAEEDPGPAARAEVSHWLRVTKNGREVPGRLWSRGGGGAGLQFDFDAPLALADGDRIVVELGPAG